MEPLSTVPEEVSSRQEFTFRGHTIELITEPEATPFTPEHIAYISPTLEFYWNINPAIVKAYTFFRSRNLPDATNFGHFRACGTNSVTSTTRGIEFFNFGMDLNHPHRVSTATTPEESGFVDNFSGTLAHEMAHIGAGGSGSGFFTDRQLNSAFIQGWTKQFGWTHLFPNVKDEATNRWVQSDSPTLGWKRNAEGFWQKGDHIIYTSTDPRNDKNIEYTTMPEKCIGGVSSYAASTLMQEDICDSMAAYILNPHVLYEGKREFIHQSIKEYRARQ